MGVREWLIPRERKFFDMLKELTEKIQESVALLRRLNEPDIDIELIRLKLKKKEHEADEIVHNIFIELNKSLITPIDKEDISNLSLKLDDIVDHIYAAVNRMCIYEIKKPTEEIRTFSKCLVDATKILNLIFSNFRLNELKEIHLLCIKIHKIENYADNVLNSGLRRLFQFKDPIIIIKLKDVYYSLETATDKCEDVANIVQDVLVKYG